MYNYWAVTDTRGLCPDRWHVARENDWIYLCEYLGTDCATQIKSTEFNGTNTIGFNALLGGSRGFDSGSFSDMGQIGLWWCPTKAFGNLKPAYKILFANKEIIDSNWASKKHGYSVRCIKD